MLTGVEWVVIYLSSRTNLNIVIYLSYVRFILIESRKLITCSLHCYAMLSALVRVNVLSLSYLPPGIGYETALDLAHRNARVILACRRMDSGEEARERIQQETGNQSVLLKHLDLSSFTSVRKFAQDVIQTEKDLHILVNNAGVGRKTIHNTCSVL